MAQEILEGPEAENQDVLNRFKTFNPLFFRAARRDEGERATIREASVTEYTRILSEERFQNAILGKDDNPEILRELFDALVQLKNEEAIHSPTLKNKDFRKFDKSHLLRELGIKLSEDEERYLQGNISVHLFRLAFPGEYSKDEFPEMMAWVRKKFDIQNTTSLSFVEAFISYVKESQGKMDVKPEILRDTIGMEGPGVTSFWTLAPYVFDELLKHGLSDMESIGVVFSWIEDGVDRIDSSDFLDHLEFVTFPEFGLMEDYELDGYDFRLGYDERMPSHLIAMLMGRKVARELVKKGK